MTHILRLLTIVFASGLLTCIAVLAFGAAYADTSSMLQATNLPGSTYKTSTLFKADPLACQRACVADKSCKSWTYRARGSKLAGYKPQCYLKNTVPEAVKATCCISGVKKVVYTPNVQVIGKAIGQAKPVFKVPPVKVVRPVKPAPKAGIQRATGNVSKPGQPRLIVAPRTRINPVNPVNPALAGAFNRKAAERGAAISRALVDAQARSDALAELRRRASSNNPSGQAVVRLDCNDNDPSIHPNQNEVCNLKDDNCNGDVDEGVTLTVYRDADGDSFGDPTAQTQVCASGSGLVGMSLNANDCDDSDARRNPAAGTCG